MLAAFCLLFHAFTFLPFVFSHSANAGSKHGAVAESAMNAGGAVIHGLIGATLTNMRSSSPQRPSTPGGCEWFGKGPWCDGMCPATFHHITESSDSRTDTTDDHYFGDWCPLGKKAYCCRSSYDDCSWGGRWQSSKTGRIYYSKFDNHYNFNVGASRYYMGKNGPQLDMDTERCGFVTFNDWRMSMENTYHKIHHTEHKQCSGFEFEGKKAVAGCGVIHFSENKKEVDTWYKMA